jgi:hypothetical protein
VIWGALAGGLLGTVVLTTLLRGASELGWTRMDLPFLLGTAVSTDRVRAKLVGYALHFVFGLLFALGYWLVSAAIDRSGILFGTLLGLVHGLFAGTAVVGVLLPAVHPRMGTGFDAAGSAPLLQPPGFLLVNYGPQTPIVTVVGHLAYGAIVGGFIGAAG